MRGLDAMAAVPLLVWAIAIVGIVGVDPLHVGPLVLGGHGRYNEFVPGPRVGQAQTFLSHGFFAWPRRTL